LRVSRYAIFQVYSVSTAVAASRQISQGFRRHPIQSYRLNILLKLLLQLLDPISHDVERLVYLGQTGDLRTRLTAHNQKKDFWERALVLVSKTNSLTQTHALFLEWHALQQIRSAGRFADENGNSGSRPHTPAPLEAECFEVFETGSVLVSSLGCPLFDPVAKPKQSEEPVQVFSLRSPSNGVEAKGLYTAEGFVVLAGSVGRADTAPSLGETNERWRQRLLDSGVMRPNDQGRLVFPKDHLFKSPSGVAIALLGRTANGWREWKNPHGQTLHELIREP
jgi:hypothetical protein